MVITYIPKMSSLHVCNSLDMEWGKVREQLVRLGTPGFARRLGHPRNWLRHPRNWLGASSESPRNHRGPRCPITGVIGHFERGPTYGTGFLGSEGGFRGFRSRARERYTTLLPPSGASRVRLGHAIAVAAIVLEPLLDQPGKLVELRSAHRRCASVARRHRKLKHLLTLWRETPQWRAAARHCEPCFSKKPWFLPLVVQIQRARALMAYSMACWSTRSSSGDIAAFAFHDDQNVVTVEQLDVGSNSGARRIAHPSVALFQPQVVLGPSLVVDEPVQDALANPLLGSRANRLVADQGSSQGLYVGLLHAYPVNAHTHYM